MTLEEIRGATPIGSTQLAWAASEGLMANRHWLEGIVGNTCAERANVPGYVAGLLRDKGRFDLERERWGTLFGLTVSPTISSSFSSCTRQPTTNTRIWDGEPLPRAERWPHRSRQVSGLDNWTLCG